VLARLKAPSSLLHYPAAADASKANPLTSYNRRQVVPRLLYKVGRTLSAS
jgi:hypothetical protein